MFGLMAITNRHACKRPLEETVRSALEGGADAIQLREKDLEGGDLFGLAERLREITRAFNAALIVNHRVDVALAVEADGVQLGWRSMRVEDARKIGTVPVFLIGASCHSADDLRAAEAAGADYALLGPVFSTPSKEGVLAPLGLARLRELVGGTALPVIAVGGIAAENVQSVRETGVAGVAVIRAIMAADDPRAAAASLKA